MDTRPRDLAVKMANAEVQFFRLPLDVARCRVREIIRQPSSNGLTSVVEKWRQLPDGQIEFAIRYFRAAD
jgi:hypothetical protein